MQYFTIEELIYSDTALKKQMRNKTTVEIERNLTRLVDTILDPLRKAYGKPIYVTSGFRCATLNKAVGGVSTSQHLTGCAADIDAGSMAKNRDLAVLITKLNLPFCQLIDEKNYAWVHISIPNTPTEAPKRQILRYNGKTYTNIKPNQL